MNCSVLTCQKYRTGHFAVWDLTFLLFLNFNEAWKRFYSPMAVRPMAGAGVGNKTSEIDKRGKKKDQIKYKRPDYEHDPRHTWGKMFRFQIFDIALPWHVPSPVRTFWGFSFGFEWTVRSYNAKQEISSVFHSFIHTNFRSARVIDLSLHHGWKNKFLVFAHWQAWQANHSFLELGSMYRRL